MSRTCQQGVCQVQEREQWWWHTILQRSSLDHRRHIQEVQQASAEIRHHLEAKEARARSSVIDAADVTAALARGELAQHGARSVAFAEGRITTRQSVRRLLRCKQEEAPNPSSRSKGKANLLARMEKQRPNMLTPLCLRWSHQQKGQFPDWKKELLHQTRSLQNQVYL